MSELAEDEKFLYTDANNEFGFIIEGNIDTTKVEDALKYNDPITDRGAFYIGEFRIASPETLKDASLSLTGFWGTANSLNGQTVPVPPFNFSLGAGKVKSNTFPEFVTLTIDSGFVLIGLTNNLGIPLGLPLTLVLKDSNSQTNQTQEIARFDYESPIQNGETIFKLADLSQKTISNRLYTELIGHSDGTGNEQLTINTEEQRLVITLGITELIAKRATARVPRLKLFREDWLKLTDEAHQISMNSARFKKCDLKLKVVSHLTMSTDFNLIFKHIFDDQGKPFSTKLRLTSKEIINLEENLAGWYLQADETFGELNPQIQIIAEGITDSSGSEILTVNFKDSIVVNARLENVEMDFVRGSINRLKVDVDPKVQKVDFEQEIPQVKFRNTRLQVEINNRIAFPLELNLSFSGRKKSGQTEIYEFRNKVIESARLLPNQTEPEEVTTILTLSNDEQFDRLVNLIPDEITISGSVLLGQYGKIGQVSRTDYINGKFAFKAPFEYSFNDTTIAFDTTYIQIKPEDWEIPAPKNIDHSISAKMTNEITRTTLKAVIENKLPVSADIIFRFDTSASKVFSDSLCAIERIVNVKSGIVGKDGFVEKAVLDSISFTLSEKEFDLFKNSESQPKIVILGVKLAFKGTKGEYYKIMADDYLHIKQSFLSFLYPVKNDD
ncbi:hypothetical protein JW964_12935 [candidate division KSB1 bacterium]|nr:hypothetical protein [candidate division KSB1 bacterium]